MLEFDFTSQGWSRLDTDLEGVLARVMAKLKAKEDALVDFVFMTPLISGFHETDDINQVYFLTFWGGDDRTEARVRRKLEALRELGFVADMDMSGWTPSLLRRPEWNGKGKPQQIWVLSR
jgi:hypothetical protein